MGKNSLIGMDVGVKNAKSGPNPKDVAVETEKSIFCGNAWSDFAANWTDGGCEWGEEMSQESRQSMEN